MLACTRVRERLREDGKTMDERKKSDGVAEREEQLMSSHVMESYVT